MPKFSLITVSIFLLSSLIACQPAPESSESNNKSKSQVTLRTAHSNWIELVQIPVADINQESLRIKEGENKAKDIQRHAQEWVTNNQDLFDKWIEESKS